MNTTKSVTVATIQDAFELAMFSGESFYNTYAAFNTPENMDMYVSNAFSVATITNEINNSSNIFLLLRENSYLVGYAKLSKELPTNIQLTTSSIELARLYIAQAHKSKGYGKYLLQYCYIYAKQENCNSIWLGVWEKNQAAINFYMHAGFEKVGQHSFLLGEDEQNDFVMLKTLLGSGN